MTPYDIATNKVRHYSSLGICPDEINGHDSLDPSCPACQILIEYQKKQDEYGKLGGMWVDWNETKTINDRLRKLTPLIDETVRLLKWFAGDAA